MIFIENGHANFKSTLAPLPGEHTVSRYTLRRALLAFCSRLQLPTEETFSCLRCGVFPRSVHLDGCRLGPCERNTGFPADTRAIVYERFIMERANLAFFPTVPERKDAIAVLTALDAAIADAAKPVSAEAVEAAEAAEAAAVEAAEAGGAAFAAPLAGKPSVLVAACNAVIFSSGGSYLRSFCVLLRAQQSSFPDYAVLENPLDVPGELAAVSILLRSLTSSAAVAPVFNAGFSTVELERWGTAGLSAAVENQQRALLLQLYPQFAVYMTHRLTLPVYLHSVVSRLRNIEAHVAAAVLKRPWNWLPDGVFMEQVRQVEDRKRGYIFPPSCSLRTSKIVVFNASGLAPPPGAVLCGQKAAPKSIGFLDPDKDCGADTKLCNHFLGSKAAADSSSVVITASCEHGRMLAMKLSPTPESLFSMIEMMMRFRHGHVCDIAVSRPLELLLVDVACLLVGYGFTRWPGLLASFRCVCVCACVWCGICVYTWFSCRICVYCVYSLSVLYTILYIYCVCVCAGR